MYYQPILLDSQRYLKRFWLLFIYSLYFGLRVVYHLPVIYKHLFSEKGPTYNLIFDSSFPLGSEWNKFVIKNESWKRQVISWDSRRSSIKCVRLFTEDQTFLCTSQEVHSTPWTEPFVNILDGFLQTWSWSRFRDNISFFRYVSTTGVSEWGGEEK